MATPGGIEIYEDEVEGGDRPVEARVVELDDGAVRRELVDRCRRRRRGKPPKGCTNRDQRWIWDPAAGLRRRHRRRFLAWWLASPLSVRHRVVFLFLF